jgi:hypothetical protein
MLVCDAEAQFICEQVRIVCVPPANVEAEQQLGFPVKRRENVGVPAAFQAALKERSPFLFLNEPPQFIALNLSNRQILHRVYTLSSGDAVLQWPERITQEEFDELGDWLDLMRRKLKRSVVSDAPEDETEPDA